MPKTEQKDGRTAATHVFMSPLLDPVPNGAFQEQLFKLLKLLITTQPKLIKFKKHLRHCLNLVIKRNTKNTNASTYKRDPITEFDCINYKIVGDNSMPIVTLSLKSTLK